MAIKGSELDLMSEEELSFSRVDMINTLSLFFTHVKYTLTLMFTLLTGVLAIVGFGVKEVSASPSLLYLFSLVASFILISLFPIALLSIKLVGRYYKLYVSCYIYTVRLHDEFAKKKHPWFEEMKEGVISIYDDSSVEEFIDGKTFGETNSWYYYKRLMMYIGYFGLIAGIITCISILWVALT